MKQHSVNRGFMFFVLVWLGYVISLFGSLLTSFALGVWVLQRTGSTTQFALISMFTLLPLIAISPFAGALVDRWDRRWVLILCNIVGAIATLSVAALLFADRLAIWHIYIATAVNSMSNAFYQPAFTASTSLLVSKQDYGRANGLVQLGTAAAQITAPMLAGALVLTIQIWSVLLIDFATFMVGVATMLAAHIPSPPAIIEGKAERGLLVREAVYGWTYITTRPGLLGLLVLFAFNNFGMGIAQVLLTPMVLGLADAAVLGRVLATAGVGMLLGGIVMSIWGGPRRRIVGILGSVLLQGIILFLGGLRPNIFLIAAAAAGVFFCGPIGSSCTQALWQSKVAPEVQGRVFAVRLMIARSAVPLAYLVAGPLADYIFKPLLVAGGPLSGSIGHLMGVGPSRGIGLLYSTLGIFLILTTIGGWLYPRLRRVEIELPDAITETCRTAEGYMVERGTRTHSPATYN